MNPDISEDWDIVRHSLL